MKAEELAQTYWEKYGKPAKEAWDAKIKGMRNYMQGESF